ncbi:MAG TPA: cytochrome c oxidase subunit 3, partial [Thermoleophilaceae bacterium]
MESASVALGHAHGHDEHHGPPPANQSSRVEAQFLGMLLFIISEVMLFGAFFTAYFFIRVVNHSDWPAQGTELPFAVALVNTVILISSSGTMHWALEGARRENRFALRAGLASTLLLGITFLTIQINEYIHIGFSPQNHAQGTIFYGLTGLHGAHVAIGLTLLVMVTVRA